MAKSPSNDPVRRASAHSITWLAGLACWGVLALAAPSLLALLGRESLALLLVLCALVAGFFLPPLPGMAASGLAVLAFNWFFVAPTYTLYVQHPGDALLLLTMLFTSWITGTLVARQHGALARARASQRQMAALQAFAEQLNGAVAPKACLGELGRLLRLASSSTPVLLELQADGPGDAVLRELPNGPLQAPPELIDALLFDHGQRRGLTFRIGSLHYLPLHDNVEVFGGVIVEPHAGSETGLDYERALCKQMANALSRTRVLAAASRAERDSEQQRTKNTLLAAIAHDFRTPLAVILNSTELIAQQLRQADAAPAVAEIVQTIALEASQLHLMSENTLQLARLDTPGLAVDCTLESVEDMLGALNDMCQRRGIAIRGQMLPAAGLLLVHCNVQLVLQALFNLVLNAHQHAHSSEVTVTFGFDAGCRQLHVTVQDDGKGLPDAYRAALLHPFAPPPNHGGHGRPADTRGVGIGLALCREVMRVHGGSISYRDNPGGGACFTCIFPQAELAATLVEEEA